ncbi:hypothetical protein KSP40_PGU010970 [Platanthera guangdongensis]|uniref:Uncharacterized protein n=1 Tax=Platanthera guangdongensis TaxID=2320717 RepID=A0ABR2LGJ5_9ASPA
MECSALSNAIKWRGGYDSNQSQHQQRSEGDLSHPPFSSQRHQAATAAAGAQGGDSRRTISGGAIGAASGRIQSDRHQAGLPRRFQAAEVIPGGAATSGGRTQARSASGVQSRRRFRKGGEQGATKGVHACAGELSVPTRTGSSDHACARTLPLAGEIAAPQGRARSMGRAMARAHERSPVVAHVRAAACAHPRLRAMLHARVPLGLLGLDGMPNVKRRHAAATLGGEGFPSLSALPQYPPSDSLRCRLTGSKRQPQGQRKSRINKPDGRSDYTHEDNDIRTEGVFAVHVSTSLRPKPRLVMRVLYAEKPVPFCTCRAWGLDRSKSHDGAAAWRGSVRLAFMASVPLIPRRVAVPAPERSCPSPGDINPDLAIVLRALIRDGILIQKSRLVGAPSATRTCRHSPTRSPHRSFVVAFSIPHQHSRVTVSAHCLPQIDRVPSPPRSLLPAVDSTIPIGTSFALHLPEQRFKSDAVPEDHADFESITPHLVVYILAIFAYPACLPYWEEERSP